MIDKKKVVVVMPAYNAAKTLERTYQEVPRPLVDAVILVDDCSDDSTMAEAKRLELEHVLRHDRNKGYGGNQKTCYQAALELSADIVIMLHPDYQYSPKLIPAMVEMINSGHFEVVLGSRILGNSAIRGGMPIYKYISNRILTFVQNILINQKLSEYHTGYRAYSKEVLKSINYTENSDNFIFDNEMLSQIVERNYSIGEITCPAKYEPDSSSIGLWSSIEYGIGVLKVSLQHWLHRHGIMSHRRYKKGTTAASPSQ